MSEIIGFDFQRMRYLIGKIPEARFRIEKARAKAEKMTSVITGMPHGSGGDHSPVEDGAIKIAELIAAYKEVVDELDGMREILNAYIDQLEDPDEKGIMRLRYMDGYTIPQIANATYKCDRRVQQILRSAEQKISLNFTPDL